MHQQSDKDRERIVIEFARAGEIPSERRPLPSTKLVRGWIYSTNNQFWVWGFNVQVSMEGVYTHMSTQGEDAALYTTIENENGSENAVVMEMKRMEMQIYPSLVVQYLGGWKWSTYATGCWCNITMHSMDTTICNTFTTMQRRQ